MVLICQNHHKNSSTSIQGRRDRGFRAPQSHATLRLRAAELKELKACGNWGFLGSWIMWISWICCFFFHDFMVIFFEGILE